MEKTIDYLKVRRRKCVQILYKLFILDENVQKLKQEVLDGLQVEEYDVKFDTLIIDILDKFEDIRDIVLPLISVNWNWLRLPNIIKAVLINGVYEINSKITEKTIVISESIDMVREFLPSWDTSFVNAILDKID